MTNDLKEEIKFLIFKQHNAIAERGESVHCAYDLRLKGVAGQYSIADNTIRYDIEQVLAVGIDRLVIHEYAHYLQYTYFMYTEHDFLFFVINQYLTLKNMGKPHCSIRAHDLSEERQIKAIDLNKFLEHLSFTINIPRPEAIRHCLLIAMAYTQPRDFDHLDLYESNLELINKIRENL